MNRISRRHFLVGAAQSATAALLAGCATVARAESTHHPLSYVDQSASLAKPPSPMNQPQPIAVPELSLETRIGQMLMVGFNGKYLADSAPILESARAGRVGSVVLFGHNIVDAAQVATLTQTLQGASPLPLLVSMDQEGGFVSRLGGWAGITPNYSQQYLGSLNDLEVTRAQARATSLALRDLGINLNLAPVVDLNLNPDNPIIGRIQRSYSADPEIVARHALATVQVHRENGVGCTLKHFPGHGSSTGDTHAGFVDVTSTWQLAEIVPYAKLIAAGEVNAIMTAHIFNATLDPELPATLSRAVISGLLREQLGYDGLIITDDMRMRAISDIYTPEDAIFKAIDAGVDIIAISNNIPGKREIGPNEAVDIIRNLVQDGRLSEERINQSCKRVLRMKAMLGLIAI